jgi:integrase/recombinase XerD
LTRFELPLGALNPLTLFATDIGQLRLLKTEHRKLKTLVVDIDSQRMQLRIESGKGQKTRMVPMAPRLLTALREYWLAYRPEVYLFPGKTPDTPLQPTTIQKMFKVAAKDAGILKNVTPHTLRHSYATGLLEAGVDLLAISRLLGHASFSTTMIYLHVRTLHLGSAPSPIDWLPIRQLPGWMQPPESKA